MLYYLWARGGEQAAHECGLRRLWRVQRVSPATVVCYSLQWCLWWRARWKPAEARCSLRVGGSLAANYLTSAEDSLLAAKACCRLFGLHQPDSPGPSPLLVCFWPASAEASIVPMAQRACLALRTHPCLPQSLVSLVLCRPSKPWQFRCAAKPTWKLASQDRWHCAFAATHHPRTSV